VQREYQGGKRMEFIFEENEKIWEARKYGKNIKFTLIENTEVYSTEYRKKKYRIKLFSGYGFAITRVFVIEGKQPRIGVIFKIENAFGDYKTKKEETK